MIEIKNPEDTNLDPVNVILPEEFVLYLSGSKNPVIYAARAIFGKLFGGVGYPMDLPCKVEGSDFTEVTETPASRPVTIYTMRQMQQIATQPPPPAPLKAEQDGGPLHLKAVDLRVLVPFPLSAKFRHQEYLGR